MEESMYQRLIAAEKRLKEIDEELVSEDIMKNIARFKEISKERAYLDPQVEAFKRFSAAIKRALMLSSIKCSLSFRVHYSNILYLEEKETKF